MHRYIEYLKRTKRDLEENLDKYLKELENLAKKNGGKIYLFGSYALQKSIGASDVDVLIEIPDSIDRLEVLHEARKLVPNRRIEIHVLNESDALVFKNLIKYYRSI
jgi:predicted nucleotidyltransferase